MKNLSSYFVFNFIYFSLVVFIFLSINGGIKSVDSKTLVLGILFGVVFIGAVLSYMKSMELGPLSYSTLFFSFGPLVPIVYGLFMWDESVNMWQFAGLVLLLITFYLASGSSRDGKQKPNFKWLIFCIVGFLGNGSLGVVSKSHQFLLPNKEINEFLIVSFMTAAILSLIIFLWYFIKKDEKVSHLKSMSFVLISIVAGVSTAIGNWLALYLAIRLPSVVQFPSVGGGTVILSSIASVLIYKEKLTRRGGIGLLIGITALVLLSL